MEHFEGKTANKACNLKSKVRNQRGVPEREKRAFEVHDGPTQRADDQS